MKSPTLTDLLQLPALSGQHVSHQAARCKICKSAAFQFDIVDFNKVCQNDYYAYGFSHIPVPYYRCRHCLFIFTDFFDDWTKEDFANFIYNADYAAVDGEYAAIRPQRIAGEMAIFLADYRSARILDYGSGNGAFAERLKASGFAAVENYDPFASPHRPSGKFDIVTCFETIEHSPFPHNTMADLLTFMKPDGCVIFSTGIQPPNINELRGNWWYIGPRNGHVSIFTLPALELLGARVGLGLYAGPDKLAFAGPAQSTGLAPLLRAIGPTTMFATLAAPDERPPLPGEAAAPRTGRADWHAIEEQGAMRFRWTGSDRIEWTLQKQPTSYPCSLTVTIPVLMDIIPGFADQCVVEIGPHRYPMRKTAGALSATAELGNPLQQPIALVTPPPRRPSEPGGQLDHRSLGLAVPVAGSIM